MASENGHHDVVQTLLGAGANVNIARSGVSHVTTLYILGLLNENNYIYMYDCTQPIQLTTIPAHVHVCNSKGGWAMMMYNAMHGKVCLHKMRLHQKNQ